MIIKNTILVLLACILSFQFSDAQEITTHQYRRVAPENMQEYLNRETTYWKILAESEIKKGNLTFWGIFQRMGGVNQENAPNILIINTFKDIDKGNQIWGGVADLFPNVKMEDIQTQTLATDVHHVFLRDLGNHIRVANADPAKDFNFVRFIYHNSKNAGKHLNFEVDKWKPLVQRAMKEGKTSIKGWGNSVILSPSTPTFGYNSASYDIFSSAHAALAPSFNEDFEIPDGFFDVLEYEQPRISNLYRRIVVVSNE